MKLLTAIATALVCFTAPLAHADPVSHEQVVGVSDVYVPNGFDSNSDAFVVVSGLFPNSCYKIKEVQVKNVDAMTQELTATAEVTEGLCLTVIVPFHHEAQLGKLAMGTHKLRFMNGDKTFMEKDIVIGK
jgi:hypothetical protein